MIRPSLEHSGPALQQGCQWRFIADPDSAACEAPAMRLPRMTTRRWMIIIVIIALLLEIEVTLRRAVDLWQKAVENELAEKALKTIPMPGYSALWCRADYHARLKEKFRRAARSPWLSVEPDPHPGGLDPL